MRHRIFVDTIEPRTTITGDELHHAVRVARVRQGEEVELFDRSGKAVRGVVESIDRDRAIVTAGDAILSRESPLALHLGMAIIQLDKFELVLQKATELGVRSIIPLVTDRVELRPERYSGKMDRWNRIIFEAVKQSGRTVIPSIEEPAAFADVVARSGTKILFDADVEAEPDMLGEVAEITILIGPEGGWSDDELRLARERECRFQRLGPRRLRAETAAIAGLAVTAAHLGDLRSGITGRA